MGDGNVELVRRGFELLAEGGVEELIPLLDPEFELITTGEVASEPDTYPGADGLRRYFDSFYEAMDRIRLQPEEFIAVGDQVVVPFTLYARGRTTGIEAGQPAAQLWDIREGRALRVRIFRDRDEAMANAGGAEAA